MFEEYICFISIFLQFLKNMVDMLAFDATII
jgi:hypothetical protein